MAGSVHFVIVGVPTERKPGENRVALTPDGARELATHGHRVLVESGAGAGSAISDDDFAAAGAQLVNTDDAWGAQRVLKVKEPRRTEYAITEKMPAAERTSAIRPNTTIIRAENCTPLALSPIRCSSVRMS